MILKAKHNILIYNFFKIYAVWKTQKHFRSVHIIGQFSDKRLPVLLLSNHISWWDGFWAMYLNRKILKRKFHFMMLENQLRKYWFFNYSGGFSVSRKSKTILESLDYAREILYDARNLVLLFPQGEIQSMHRQSFHFERGIERIVKNNEGKLHILFMANLVDYFSGPRPSVYFYFSDFDGSDYSPENIEEAYNRFYSQCVERQKELSVEE